MGTRRGAAGGLATALLAALALTACSGTDSDDGDPASATQTASPTSAPAGGPGAPGAGEPVATTSPEPSELATDAPVEAPEDGEAVVVVTYAEWDRGIPGVAVGAHVQAVTESGGTCTLTLEQGDRTSSVTGPGEREPSATSCPGLVLPGEELGSGTWTVTVTYESDGFSGTSDPVEVTIP